MKRCESYKNKQLLEKNNTEAPPLTPSQTLTSQEQKEILQKYANEIVLPKLATWSNCLVFAVRLCWKNLRETAFQCSITQTMTKKSMSRQKMISAGLVETSVMVCVALMYYESLRFIRCIHFLFYLYLR